MSGTVVVLVGAPGSGKGTQAARLAPVCGCPHVATGDLFRENVREGTELGRRARTFMDAGELVPDELVLDMLFERVAREDCAGGLVLDGFPRTLPQAEALDERLPSLHGGMDRIAALLVVSDETIVVRAAGRLVCARCGRVHHESFSPPRAEGRCDACGGELERRPDDDLAVVRERLSVYRRDTAPVIQHYRRADALRTVDGEGTPDEVFRALLAAVNDRLGAAG